MTTMASLADSQRLLGERLSYSVLCVSVSLLLVAGLWYNLKPNKMPTLPIALQAEVPNEKERIQRYISDTRNILVSGYRQFKDEVFGITTTEGTSIVLPLKYLDDLKGQRTLTFAAFLEEQFTLKDYTKLGNLSVAEIQVLNKELNPRLPQYAPVIQDLVRAYWPFDSCQNPSTVKPYNSVNRLVSRICARMFMGPEAATDDQWLDVASSYIKSAEHLIGSLKRWPRPLRRFVWLFVPGRTTFAKKFEQGRAKVAAVLQKKKANGNCPLADPPSYLDLLTVGKTAIPLENTEAHTILQMNLCVAAIQAMGATVMQSLIDISVHPEYVPQLREEIETALSSTGGVWNKQSLAQLLKLDSFLKETQRLNSPDLTSFQRKVRDPLSISNGMYIPKGATLVIPTGAINMDENYFEAAEKFDGFRFYRQRQASEDAQTKHQLVTVGKTDLAWGYGRHACPGRFMADVVMKILMAEFLMRYDIRNPNGGSRPKNIEFEGILAPDPAWELIFEKRK